MHGKKIPEDHYKIVAKQIIPDNKKEGYYLLLKVLVIALVMIGLLLPLSASAQTAPAATKCNCVIFRYDDIQDFWIEDAQIKSLDILLKSNMSVSVGIIMNSTGDDPVIVDKVQEGITKGLFEPAIHGWSHIDYTTLTEEEQIATIRDAQEKMMYLFGDSSNVFIPPYNKFNFETIKAVREAGLHIISGRGNEGIQGRSEFGDIVHMPQTIEFANHEDRTAKKIPLTQIMAAVDKAIAADGYAVIVLHPQDFVVNFAQNSDATNPKELQELSSLIQMVKEKQYKSVDFCQAAAIVKGEPV
jgi:peptidoglycan/xylan/chitin deacetylase (PgdA/CDA1 family)